MSRGNQGQSIFKDDEDRERYLVLLKKAKNDLATGVCLCADGKPGSPSDRDWPDTAIEGDAKPIISLHVLLEPSV